MSEKKDRHQDPQARKDPATKKLIIALIVVASLVAAALVYKLVFSPDKAAAVVVELDTGHGGDDPGNTGLINESDFNIGVATQLEKLLKADSRFKVILSHPFTEGASVDEKAAKINADKPDIVLSIHANADAHNADKSGMQIYADIPSSASHAQSLKVADAVRDAFTADNWKPGVYYYYYKEIKPEVYVIDLKDESDTADYSESTLRIMQECEVPVVEIEQIYVTSQGDVDTWANEDGYQKAAQLYYQALKSVYGVK